MRSPLTQTTRKVLILVHGGAGPRRPGRVALQDISRALQAGFSILMGGGPSLDAVEAAVRYLEASGRFNAGSGSRLQLDGTRRMDAAIMEGRDLRAGAVASLEGIASPIAAARLVMEKTPHTLLTGRGAARLARAFKLPRGSSPSPHAMKSLRQDLRRPTPAVRAYRSIYGHETVGAVALDHAGNLSAACSTGGIRAMLPGRVGDTPVIGAGLYADNDSAAIAMTGWGEGIMRTALAKEIACRITCGVTPYAAARRALAWMLERVRGEAGAILISAHGRFALIHTTPYMAGGYMRHGTPPVIAVRFQRV